MKNFSIRKKTYNLIAFFIWFTPILATGSYSRFYNYGMDINIIKVFIFVSINDRSIIDNYTTNNRIELVIF